MGENSSGHKKIVESPSATQASNMGKSTASTVRFTVQYSYKKRRYKKKENNEGSKRIRRPEQREKNYKNEE